MNEFEWSLIIATLIEGKAILWCKCEHFILYSTSLQEGPIYEILLVFVAFVVIIKTVNGVCRSVTVSHVVFSTHWI